MAALITPSDVVFERIFQEGRESLAQDLEGFLNNYMEEDCLGTSDIREFIDLLLGYELEFEDTPDALLDAEAESRIMGGDEGELY